MKEKFAFFRFIAYFCAIKTKKRLQMNYEELLESRNGAAMNKEQLPFGQLYKKVVDSKYVNTLDLRPELSDSLVFCDALVSESKQNAEIHHPRQVHFTVNADSAGIYGINLEQGNYRTFQHLLEDSPAVVAQKNFISETIEGLLEFATELHNQGICHVCYAPSNVLARKGDNAAMLLFHGSAYQAVRDQSMLYAGSEDYVAPEVLEEGTITERADVYSIGRFIEFLYRDSSMPVELKTVVKKATQADPEKRYDSAAAMLSAIGAKRNMRRSLLTLVGALAAAAVVIGLYFAFVPENQDIEYVPLPEKSASEDPYSDQFNLSNLAPQMGDTVATETDERRMKEYEAKAEQIFRKRYTEEAERVLSNIYNKENMSATERDFMATSSSVMEELVKAQVRMGGEAGLSDARSQSIATEIIEQVSNRKKGEMADRAKAQSEEKSNVKPIIEAQPSAAEQLKDIKAAMKKESESKSDYDYNVDIEKQNKNNPYKK